MIIFENTEVEGWRAALRGMRNPMNSWDKADSNFCDEYACSCCHCYKAGDDNECEKHSFGDFVIGPNDYMLATQLAKAGSDHSKFLRMINVTVDITAPLYWWAEMDTYKVGTVRNSCSKMHKLLSKPFEVADFSFEKLSGYKNEVKQFVPEMSEEDVAQEIWVCIDSEYSVSNYGRVKHIFKNHYRIISGSLHNDGYRFVTLHGKQIPIHRIVAKHFHNDTYDEELVVNHIDGNKQNNHEKNLEWVSQSENIKHSIENNLQPNPVNTYKGKFTAEQRKEIKCLWDEGILSKRKIAEKYGVSHTCINSIINDDYAYYDKINLFEKVAKPWVDTLNELRDMYLRSKDSEEKKKIWYSIIQLLPESYNQRATVQLNYQVLRNIYHSDRKHHKLDEWREGFMQWIESLPYSELITDHFREATKKIELVEE